jgi:hypothetical protein
LLLDTGCSDYEQKYELFTRNEIGAGAKYFQDSTEKYEMINRRHWNRYLAISQQIHRKDLLTILANGDASAKLLKAIVRCFL